MSTKKDMSELLIVFLILGIALFFLFVYLVQITYNNSIHKLRRNNEDIEKLDYWSAMVFVLFLILLSSIFGVKIYSLNK